MSRPFCWGDCRKQRLHSCICKPMVQAASDCRAKGLNTHQTTHPSQGWGPFSAPLAQSPPGLREKVNVLPKLGYRPSQQQGQQLKEDGLCGKGVGRRAGE